MSRDYWVNLRAYYILNEDLDPHDAAKTIEALVKVLPNKVHDGTQLITILRNMEGVKPEKTKSIMERVKKFIIKCADELYKLGEHHADARQQI